MICFFDGKGIVHYNFHTLKGSILHNNNERNIKKKKFALLCGLLHIATALYHTVMVRFYLALSWSK